MIKDYLRTAPDADSIRLASSYLEGGPRSLWTSVYEAYKAETAEPSPLTLVSFSVRRLRRIMTPGSGPEVLGHLEQFEARPFTGHC
jgi:hypothetical protein